MIFQLIRWKKVERELRGKKQMFASMNHASHNLMKTENNTFYFLNEMEPIIDN